MTTATIDLDENKTERVTLRLQPSLKAEAEQMARETDDELGAIARRALRKAVEEWKASRKGRKK